MRKLILFILSSGLCFMSSAQLNKLTTSVYTGLGYQDVIGPIRYGEAIEYEGFSLGNATRTTGVYLDIGIAINQKSHQVGAGLRIAQSEQWDSETVKYKFLLDVLPRAWYSYYFGKYDGRGFRADFSLLLDWEKMGVEYDPVNPSDIPNKPLYVCFGPQVGTRIIRKGAFANTYFVGGPVFAPPVAFDRYIVANPSWNIRWMLGLAKNLYFKKTSQ